MKANQNASKGQRANQSTGGRSARERAASWKGNDSEIKAISREFENPVDYDHPYASMKRFAELLALRYDCNRTRY
jgi:hypothetical protein